MIKVKVTATKLVTCQASFRLLVMKLKKMKLAWDSCGNQTPCSARIENVKRWKCGKC